MTGTRSNPTVSIGLPVFNGERFLARALDSLLAQTFRDFEVIVSDNASTDQTEQIGRAYAARDQRILYFRNSTATGAAKNFNRAFELSAGKYFKWMSHNEWLAPRYLEQSIAAMETDPSVVLCSCAVVVIDDDESYASDPTYLAWSEEATQAHGVDSSKAYKRFHQMLWSATGPDPVYCLVRADAVRKTQPLRDSAEAHKLFALSLSLVGPFLHLAEPLAFRTRFPARTILQAVVRIDPHSSGVALPHWSWGVESLRVARSAPVWSLRKAYLMGDVAAFILAWHYHQLTYDLLRAARALLQRTPRAVARFLRLKWDSLSRLFFHTLDKEHP